MGVSGGNGVLLEDVTGDGVRDVVVASMFADVGAVADAGTILVWAGGATLVGQLPPLATLQAAHLQAFDQLTGGKRAGLSVAEVTGDGVLDVIAVSPLDDLLGHRGRGHGARVRGRHRDDRRARAARDPLRPRRRGRCPEPRAHGRLARLRPRRRHGRRGDRHPRGLAAECRHPGRPRVAGRGRPPARWGPRRSGSLRSTRTRPSASASARAARRSGSPT